VSQLRRFIQCDVFTSQPTRGNALAVVVDGVGLTTDQMQPFAAWTNLAETTFILPPTKASADYHVRIFTPVREMPFAGHPTLGTCAAWLHTGGRPQSADVIRQQCAVGIVPIQMGAGLPAFEAPPTRIEPLPADTEARLIDRLALDRADIVATAKLDNGPIWQAFELTSADAVLAVDASRINWQADKSIGLIGPHPTGSECDYEVRVLAPSSGMAEDPITGSLNAAIAHWMLSRGCYSTPVTIAQGTRINRLGRVYVSPDRAVPNRVLIGGQTHILVDGTVNL